MSNGKAKEKKKKRIKGKHFSSPKIKKQTFIITGIEKREKRKKWPMCNLHMGIFVIFSFKFFFFFFFLNRKFIGHSSKNFHFSFSIFSIILKIQTYPNFINYDYWKVKYKRKCKYTR